MQNEDIFIEEKDVKDLEEKSTVGVLLDVRAQKREETTAKRIRLTPSQWREIELLWESGEVTLKDLSRRYGKHEDTFTNHFRKHGIKRGARADELRKIAEQAAKEQARDEASIISERIRKTKESHYKMSEAIGNLVFSEVLNVRKDKSRYREIQQDLKALFIAMDTLKKVREERWVVLGLDKDAVDEDALPELVMSTMTPEQVEALRKAQQEDDELIGMDDDQLEYQEVEQQ